MSACSSTEVPFEGREKSELPRLKDHIMREKHVGFVGVLEGVDVGGSSSVTDESAVGKGTASPRSNVCSSGGGGGLCF